jgi:hypothetical protein
LLMDDDTIRGWHKLFEQRGIEGLTSFDMGGSAGFLSTGQEDALKAYVSAMSASLLHGLREITSCGTQLGEFGGALPA